MPRNTAPATRLSLLVVAAVAAAASLVGIAGPATAAPTITFTQPAQAVVDQPFDVSWVASSEVESLTATGDWTTPGPVDLRGSQTIRPTAEGTLSFTLTGQVAGGGQPVVQTVTVDVAAASTEVTAVAPTYPETCAVAIPDVEGVDYVVDFGGGDTETLDPDTYPVGLFVLSGVSEVKAQAQDGFTLAPGSPTSFTLQVDDSCVPQERELVRTTTGCRTVTFTNLADEESLYVAYGSDEEEDPDGEFVFGSGESRTITTDSPVLFFFAGSPEVFDEDTPVDDPFDFNNTNFQTGDVRVQLDCGDHPTVAPAAGR